jgi:hypothetical protein
MNQISEAPGRHLHGLAADLTDEAVRPRFGLEQDRQTNESFAADQPHLCASSIAELDKHGDQAADRKVHVSLEVDRRRQGVATFQMHLLEGPAQALTIIGSRPSQKFILAKFRTGHVGNNCYRLPLHVSSPRFQCRRRAYSA